MMTIISFFVKKKKKITCTDDKNMFKINCDVTQTCDVTQRPHIKHLVKTGSQAQLAIS